MSISNNKFKSTTIYGKLVVADTPDGSITADTILNRNLTVVGKINNIPSETINYISNLTSDAQTQLTTLKTKTTDVTYDSLTLTSTYTNNLIVNGKINNIPKATINYIANLTSDAQTQINNKSNSSDLTPLTNKTTDLIYDRLTLTSTYTNNLIVSGKINNVPYSKFAY
jgi:hypothetical protein